MAGEKKQWMYTLIPVKGFCMVAKPPAKCIGKTKSTEVYIKGGTYDHAEGMAPVPTVKFTGMRGGVSNDVAP